MTDEERTRASGRLMTGRVAKGFKDARVPRAEPSPPETTNKPRVSSDCIPTDASLQRLIDEKHTRTRIRVWRPALVQLNHSQNSRIGPDLIEILTAFKRCEVDSLDVLGGLRAVSLRMTLNGMAHRNPCKNMQKISA